jgi:HSP20 family protein
MATDLKKELSRSAEESPQTRTSPTGSLRSFLDWDPFRSFSPLFGRLSEQASQHVPMPAFDVKETSTAFEFKADMPGFKEDDLELNLEGNRLTISGHRESDSTNASDRYHLTERSAGAFSRSFTLPNDIDADQVQANLANGILSLVVPKNASSTQPRRIALNKQPPAKKTKGDS